MNKNHLTNLKIKVLRKILFALQDENKTPDEIDTYEFYNFITETIDRQAEYNKIDISYDECKDIFDCIIKTLDILYR